MPSSLTAGRIIEDARLRHAAFMQSTAPDGALLRVLDARQRSLLLQYSGAIDGLVTTTVDMATVIAGQLVGQDNGVPVYITTVEDGWPVQNDNGVAVFDFSGPPIAADPFGQNGGTPGFPLPDDFVKLIQASLTYSNGRTAPMDVIAESARFERRRAGTPAAFVSGNRLVPVRALASGNSGDAWDNNIASVQLSYIALPVLTALSDPITLPAALTEALTAGIAEHLALSTSGVSAGVQDRFTAAAQRSVEALQDFGADVVVSTGRVAFRG